MNQNTHESPSSSTVLHAILASSTATLNLLTMVASASFVSICAIAPVAQHVRSVVTQRVCTHAALHCCSNAQ
jgi:hypothetical protein